MLLYPSSFDLRFFPQGMLWDDEPALQQLFKE